MMEVEKSSDRPSSVNSLASDEDMFTNKEVCESLRPRPIDAKQPTTSSIAPECVSGASNSSSVSLGSIDKGSTWRGTPLNKLSRNTCKSQVYPPVVVGPHHSVLFKLPVAEGEVPQPWPEKPVDIWDQNHVRMPHSASSLYPVTSTELRRRWELVQQALNSTISTSHQLESAILHYNSKYSDRWDFQALHTFFSETLEEMETEYFFTKVLPKVVDLALSIPTLLTTGIPLLRKHVTHSISLSQQQISCLLANAFLCTFPRRNTSKKNSEYSAFPDINFNRLFSGDGAQDSDRSTSLQEKLKCLVNYFRRVTTKVPDGVVSYSRHYVLPDRLPVWSQETACLPDMHVSSSGTIEDNGTGMLQMDFANKFVGGGVLGRGCVQEEIRFVICPELILARLFTEVLDDTEALIITGCERFSNYRGYADSFEWAGNNQDSTPRDTFGRRYCTLVAIDAFRFPNAKTQYSAANINRELNKAYAGFSWGMVGGEREGVATGNWGCGAFRGDASLKSLLQLMAAATTKRDLAYFTFGDEELRNLLADMHSFLVQQHITVGCLWKLISSYNPALHHHSLYDHIYRSINTNSTLSPLKTVNPFSFKKPRVQERTDNGAKRKEWSSNGHQLNTEEIVKVLESVNDNEDDTEGVKPSEARTLSVKQDKELCLKRLSSSWTNLNDSKKDFKFSETSSASVSNEMSHKTDSYRHSSQLSGGGTSRKKKISDYFQTVSKS